MSTFTALGKKVRAFFSREDGASAIEYSIIAGLISVVFIAAAATVGKDVNTTFTNISAELAKAKPAATAQTGGTTTP